MCWLAACLQIQLSHQRAKLESCAAWQVQRLLSTATFRCYRSHDVTGVELGGALKNVLAIGAPSLPTCHNHFNMQTFSHVSRHMLAEQPGAGPLRSPGRAQLTTSRCSAACGVADGMGFGHNARAALITRGLAEVTRLAVALGAHPLTMGGLAGMGDLVLTCTGGAAPTAMATLLACPFGSHGSRLPLLQAQLKHQRP